MNPYTPPSALLVDRPDEVARLRRAPFWWAVSACLTLTFIAVIMTFSVPTFRDLFISFGASLPLPTRLLLDGYRLLWILPSIPLILIFDLFRRSVLPPEYRDRMIVVFVCLVILAVLLLLGAIYALYLPIMNMK